VTTERPLVLVIDDVEAVRKLIEELLLYAGYRTATAADGAAGLKICRETAVSLVITDLVMPEMEGFETMAALRREFPGLPIMAVSGTADNLLDAARFLGASATIAKPFDAKVLLATVHRLLQKVE